MKALRSIIGLIILTFLLQVHFSCSNRLVTGIKGGVDRKTFDNSAFDFYFVEAVKQKLMGSPSEALRYLEQCIKINPNSDAAYYQMAQIAMRSGDPENGKRFSLKAYSLDNENIWYIMTLAGIYYEQEKLDSAIYYYEKAVSLKPEREDLRLNLGNLYAENREYVKARQILSNIGNDSGINESSLLSIIKTLMEEGNYNEAQKRIEELLKQNPDETLYNGLLAEIYRYQGQNEKALEIYGKMMTKNPKDPQTLLALCDFLIDEKKYSDLLIVLNSVILNDAITREEKVSIFARLMEDEAAVKEHGQGIELALRVLEANYPDDDIVALLRPDMMEKEGRLRESAERLLEIIRERPENYYAWERLLLVYYSMKDWKNLLLKGEECATKFNRSFLAKVLYANAAMENKKYDIALDELRKAMILAGDNKDMIMQVTILRAEVYYRQKDYDNAFKTFDDALKINNEDLTVLNNYAYFLAEQNRRLNEAEKMSRKVIESAKDNPTFLDTYAWIMYKKGKYGKAAKIMESVMKMENSTDAEYYEHYGYILKGQKNCKRAVEYWNTALRIDTTKNYLLKEIQNCRR